MKRNKIYGILLSALFATPFFVNAKTFKDFVETATGDVASAIVGLIFAVAALFFFWGVVQYVLNPTQEGKDKGRGYIIWGVIGLAVMFSVYSLIRLVTSVVF